MCKTERNNSKTAKKGVTEMKKDVNEIPGPNPEKIIRKRRIDFGGPSLCSDKIGVNSKENFHLFISSIITFF